MTARQSSAARDGPFATLRRAMSARVGGVRTRVGTGAPARCRSSLRGAAAARRGGDGGEDGDHGAATRGANTATAPATATAISTIAGDHGPRRRRGERSEDLLRVGSRRNSNIAHEHVGRRDRVDDDNGRRGLPGKSRRPGSYDGIFTPYNDRVHRARAAAWRTTSSRPRRAEVRQLGTGLGRRRANKAPSRRLDFRQTPRSGARGHGARCAVPNFSPSARGEGRRPVLLPQGRREYLSETSPASAYARARRV